MAEWENKKYITFACDRQLYETDNEKLTTLGTTANYIVLNGYNNLENAREKFDEDIKEWNKKATPYQRATFLSFAIAKNPNRQ